MTSPKNHEEFIVTFHGPAVDDHSMSARDLGESMLALGSLVEIASVKLYGPENKGELLIKGPRSGSFEVAYQILGEQVGSLFRQNPVGVIQLLIGMSGLNVLGLIQLYRALKGKLPKETYIEGNNTHLSVNGTNSNIIVLNETYQMYTDPHTRQTMRSVLTPLSGDRMERVDFKQNDDVQTVTKGEIEYYEVELDGDPDHNEMTQTLYVAIASFSFKPGEKWRVSTGEDDTPFFVEITDKRFVENVSHGVERFKAKDVLHVKLKTIQSLEDGRLKTEREVIKVLKHLPVEEQTTIDFDSNTT